MTWIKPDRATGMGSLPHDDLSTALSIIAHSLPHWPHWPQLPSHSPEQGFVVQYVHPLIKLGLLTVTPPKDPVFTRGSAHWDEQLLRFYELYLAFQAGDAEAEEFFTLDSTAFLGLEFFLEHFTTHFPHAEGVKGQISGPLTVGLQIKDERGRAAFYDEALRDLIVKCMAIQGVLQARKLQSIGLPVLLFIDDPSIFLLGASSHITLTAEAISAALTEIITPLSNVGVRIGVHICAQADWSVLFNLPLDVVSFDAYKFFQSMSLQAPALQQFLEKGGHMAWGLVPTSDVALSLTVADLQALFETQCNDLEKRGVNLSLFRKQLLWTPSCGTGALPVELAEHIYQLLHELTL